MIVGGRFHLGRKIGQGSFGKVYVSTDSETREDVAVKLESLKTKVPQLLAEAKTIAALAGGLGIPHVIWSGTEGDNHAMAVELLGPSLEDLFVMRNKELSHKTVYMLADQMINRIEYIHSKHWIHRDIKPANFVLGIGKKASLVHAIDFGLSKRFRNPKTLEHNPYGEHTALTGTARYASINTHLGIEQSRRDDLESIGYVLVYFCKGQLPWQGIKAASKKEKYAKIMEKKLATPIDKLCKDLPVEFSTYINYCRSLKFEERPDYAFLRGLLRGLLFREGHRYDLEFDWTNTRLHKESH